MNGELFDALERLKRIRNRDRLGWDRFERESPDIAKPLGRALDAMGLRPPKLIDELPGVRALREREEPWRKVESRQRIMRPAEPGPLERDQDELLPWWQRRSRWP